MLLLGQATVITPNAFEAELLTGIFLFFHSNCSCVLVIKTLNFTRKCLGRSQALTYRHGVLIRAAVHIRGGRRGRLRGTARCWPA